MGKLAEAKHWRLDPAYESRENTLFLESTARHDLGDGESRAAYTLYLKRDECCHLSGPFNGYRGAIAEPVLPWDGNGIGDYLHLCGAAPLLTLAEMLTEAHAIAVEWFGERHGFWEKPR